MNIILLEDMFCLSESSLSSSRLAWKHQQQPFVVQFALSRKPKGSVERKWAVTLDGLLFLVYCFIFCVCATLGCNSRNQLRLTLLCLHNSKRWMFMGQNISNDSIKSFWLCYLILSLLFMGQGCHKNPKDEVFETCKRRDELTVSLCVYFLSWKRLWISNTIG